MSCDFFSSHGDFTLTVRPDQIRGTAPSPPGCDPAAVPQVIREALLAPSTSPKLESVVVPGDRVAIALDPAAPGWSPILREMLACLRDGGVASVDVIAPEPCDGLPEGATLHVHDPADREGMAYLATTSLDSRVYLNRRLVDADVVLALGRVSNDPALGTRGPWNAVFPDLGDAPRQYSTRPRDPGKADFERAAAGKEALEVNWLLGSCFQVGVIPGVTGVAKVLAGDPRTLEGLANRRHRELWTIKSPEPVGLFVGGVGESGTLASWDDFALAIRAGQRFLSPGGTLVIVARFGHELGPALQRVVGHAESAKSARALKGAEAEPDFEAARALRAALDSCRICLLSDWPDEVVTDLGMVALDSPKDVQNVVTKAETCLIVSRAEQVRGKVKPDS